jgi:hypothetical protein
MAAIQIWPIAVPEINIVYHVMMDVDVYLFIQHWLEQKKSVYASVKILMITLGT